MRETNRLITKAIATCLVAVLVVGFAGRGRLEAMLAPTETSAGFNRAADEAKIQGLLERKVIQQRLKDLGYDKADIERKMSRLSDAQIHQVAMNAEKQFPAGDGGTVWIIVGAVLLLILLIAAIDDDDDDDDDRDRDNDSATDVNVESQAPPQQQTPQTIIVK